MYPAVILAGGLGKRLRVLTGNYPKYFFKIFDYPLIMYPVNTLLLSGVKKFVIVVADKYLRYMENTINQYLCGDAEVEYVGNPYPIGENGFSLLLAAEKIIEPYFILSVADHIYSPRIVKSLQKSFSQRIDILVGSDSNPKYINIAEATKILAEEDGRLLRIGKRLKKFTHIDIGLFLMKTQCIKKFIHLKEDKQVQLSRLIYKVAEKNNNVYVSDINSGLWTDVDTVSDVIEILYGKRREVAMKVLEEIEIYVQEGSG